MRVGGIFLKAGVRSGNWIFFFKAEIQRRLLPPSMHVSPLMHRNELHLRSTQQATYIFHPFKRVSPTQSARIGAVNEVGDASKACLTICLAYLECGHAHVVHSIGVRPGEAL
jgi:hypothetical protein